MMVIMVEKNRLLYCLMAEIQWSILLFNDKNPFLILGINVLDLFLFGGIDWQPSTLFALLKSSFMPLALLTVVDDCTKVSPKVSLTLFGFFEFC